MKSRTARAVRSMAVVAGIVAYPALDAGAADTKAYLIGKVTIHDKSWMAEYRAESEKLLKKYGGRVLVRGSPVEALEGDDPEADVVVILEFPSLAKAKAWHSDPEYRPLKELRRGGTTSRFVLMEQVAD